MEILRRNGQEMLEIKNNNNNNKNTVEIPPVDSLVDDMAE